MKLTPQLLLLLTIYLTVYASAATAQTSVRNVPIYRCGADGRDLRDSPCPAQQRASASQLSFDQPSAGQAEASKQNATADARRADAMEKARLKQEAEARRYNSKAAGIDGLKTVGPVASAPAAKPPASTHSPKPPKHPNPPKSPKPPKTAAEVG